MTRARRTIFERWHAMVDKTETCWLWTGATDPYGYGKLDTRGAHRVGYELLIGPIPEGLQLDHLCRVRHCVNPAHLEPVTQTENVRRGMSPGAIANRTNVCQRGHEFTAANTYTRPDGSKRLCRACRRIRDYAPSDLAA